MYLRRIRACNYRSFGDGTSGPVLDWDLNPGLNILVGENDAGKTAIIDAIRQVLLTTSYESVRLFEHDFHVEGSSRARSLFIEATLCDLSEEQESSVLEWLTFEDDDTCSLIIHLQAKYIPAQSMRRARAPLSVDTFIELERLLAEGFREDYEHPLGRWMAKVRYVLQVALMPIATEELHTRIEQIFRPYNPARIERFRIIEFSTPSSGWLTTLSNQNGAIQPICGDDVYLDFLERIWVEDRWLLFRLTAFFYNRNTAPVSPEHSATFLSTDQPMSGHAKRQDSCATVAVAPAFFGSFTPALPSATLKQLTGTTGTDLTRGYWRIGRLSESRGAGPKNEGCFLSVKRANLRRLPDNVRLAWVYEVDGIKRGVVTYG